jgi:lipoprotein-releasing system permease protein
MKLAFFIARRYLFSQKKRSVINAISWISLIGIAIGTMALIVVLSVYNGIGDLTQSLFNVFDPELKIEAKKGKPLIWTAYHCPK